MVRVRCSGVKSRCIVDAGSHYFVDTESHEARPLHQCFQASRLNTKKLLREIEGALGHQHQNSVMKSGRGCIAAIESLS